MNSTMAHAHVIFVDEVVQLSIVAPNKKALPPLLRHVVVPRLLTSDMVGRPLQRQNDDPAFAAFRKGATRGDRRGRRCGDRQRGFRRRRGRDSARVHRHYDREHGAEHDHRQRDYLLNPDYVWGGFASFH